MLVQLGESRHSGGEVPVSPSWVTPGALVPVVVDLICNDESITLVHQRRDAAPRNASVTVSSLLSVLILLPILFG